MADTNTLYHAALYARRKFIERTQPDEPDPLTADQIKAMKTHLKDFPDIKITGVYMDSRKTGIDHPCPQFQRMIHDIQEGRYTCVVMYSLDTFGKDIYENRYYVLRQFTAMGIRILSLLDDYDSSVSEPTPGDFTRLEELIEQNSKFDSSRSHSATMKEKKLNGYWELTFTPYGYLYRPDTESNLEIDPETEQYVRFIFNEFLSGTSRTKIAKRLTEMGAPSPSLRKKQLGITYTKPSAKDYWTMGGVNVILKNQMYTGDLVYGTQRAAMYVFREAQKRFWTGKPQIVPDHHDPIISRKDFDRAQVMLNMLKQEWMERRKKKPASAPLLTPFRNLVFCGHCGRSMFHLQYRSNRNPYSVYICSSHRYKLDNACPLQLIRLEDVIPEVQAALEKERLLAIKICEQIKEGEQSDCYRQLERHFQSLIDQSLKHGKENTAELIALSDTEQERKKELEDKGTALRKDLVDAINAKQAFKRAFNINNPWLRLYTGLEDGFTITPAVAKKYISQIILYRDAPLVVKEMKQDAKEKLLSYLSLAESGDLIE